MVSLCCEEGRRSHDQDSVLPMAGHTQRAPAKLVNRRCTKHRTLLFCSAGLILDPDFTCQQNYVSRPCANAEEGVVRSKAQYRQLPEGSLAACTWTGEKAPYTPALSKQGLPHVRQEQRAASWPEPWDVSEKQPQGRRKMGLVGLTL